MTSTSAATTANASVEPQSPPAEAFILQHPAFASMATGYAILVRSATSARAAGTAQALAKPRDGALAEHLSASLSKTVAGFEATPVQHYDTDPKTYAKLADKLRSAPFWKNLPPLVRASVDSKLNLNSGSWSIRSFYNGVVGGKFIDSALETLDQARTRRKGGYYFHSSGSWDNINFWAAFENHSKPDGVVFGSLLPACEADIDAALPLLRAAAASNLESVCSEFSKTICAAVASDSDARLYFPLQAQGLKISKLKLEGGGNFRSAYAWTAPAPVLSPARLHEPSQHPHIDHQLAFGGDMAQRATTIPGKRAILPSASIEALPQDACLSIDTAANGSDISPASRLREASIRCALASADGVADLSRRINPLANFLSGRASGLAGRGLDSALAAVDLLDRMEMLSLFSQSDDPWIVEHWSLPEFEGDELEGAGRDKNEAAYAESKARTHALAKSVSENLTQSRPLLDKARELISLVSELAVSIEARSSAIAQDREASWYRDAGLSEALEAARLGMGTQVSAEQLAFYAKSPESAKAAVEAASNPGGFLAVALSKAAGVSAKADNPEQLVETAKSSLAEQGLSREAFDAVAASQPLSSALSSLAASVFEADPRRADPDRLEALRLCFRALSSWAAKPEDARRDPQWLADAVSAAASIQSEGHRARAFFEFGGSALSGVTVNNLTEARFADAAGSAKEASSPALSLMVLEILKAPDEGDSPLSRLKRKIRDDGAPNARWDLLGPEPTASAVLYGLRPDSAHAFDEACSWGARERLAALAATAWAPEPSDGEPRSANAWVGVGKSALASRLGLGSSQWREIGNDPSRTADLAAWLDGQAVAEAWTRGFRSGTSCSDDPEDACKGILRWMGWEIASGFDKAASKRICSAAGEIVNDRWRVDEALRFFWEQLEPERAPKSDDGRWTVSDAAQARAALAECEAKAAKVPAVAKALCQRLADLSKRSSPEEAWTTFTADLDNLQDWLTKSERGVWTRIPEKCTWGTLWRLQEDWHREVAASSPGSASQWHALLSRVENGAWTAVELSSGRALTEEGKAMHHCVSSYAGECRRGHARIFSIRRNGERVCTLELGLHQPGGQRIEFKSSSPDAEDLWKIVQNKGSCNAAVKDPAALDFCEFVKNAQNAAHLALAAELAEKRRLAAEAAAAARKAAAEAEAAAAPADGSEPKPPKPPKKKSPPKLL